MDHSTCLVALPRVADALTLTPNLSVLLFSLEKTQCNAELALHLPSDGHCGALRQKDLLSSDAVVLAVQSSHELWHYPIMMPW